MKARLDLIRKPIIWRDIDMQIPAFFQATVKSPDAFCSKCKAFLGEIEQVYIQDQDKYLDGLKARVKKITKIRRAMIMLYNVRLFCFNCIPDVPVHRVVLKIG